MSAIFAYAGDSPCRDIIIDAVSRLSSEKFELSGVAMKCGDKIETVRIKGNPRLLESNSKELNDTACAGLGESKTAHRCKPSGITAPPSADENFCVAVDGVIENFELLKKHSEKPFPIATDEDLLLSLLEGLSHLEPADIIGELSRITEGDISYVFIRINEEAVYAKAGKNPLVIGVCDDGFCVSSELAVTAPYIKKYCFLENGEYAKLTAGKLVIYDSNRKKIKKQTFAYADNNSPNLRSYLPSLSEPPLPIVIKNTVSSLIRDGKMRFDSTRFSTRALSKINRIIITGTGAVYRAAVLSAEYIEAFCDIPCRAYEANELNASGVFFDRNTMLIAVSPSGEEREIVSCVKRANRFQALTLGITGERFCMLERECKKIINLNLHGSYPSFYTYASSVLAMNIFALWLGSRSGIISDMYLSVAIKLAELLPGKISGAIKAAPHIKKAAELILSSETVFVTGIGTDYSITLQAANEIKNSLSVSAFSELCSDISEGNAKLISGSLIIFFITDREHLKKSLYYLRRFASLGAEILIYTTENTENELGEFGRIIPITDSLPVFDSTVALSALIKTVDMAKDIIAAEEEQQAG